MEKRIRHLLYLVIFLPALGLGNEHGFGVQLGVPLAVGRQIDGDIPFHASFFYDFYVGDILGIGGEIGGTQLFYEWDNGRLKHFERFRNVFLGVNISKRLRVLRFFEFHPRIGICPLLGKRDLWSPAGTLGDGDPIYSLDVAGMIDLRLEWGEVMKIGFFVRQSVYLGWTPPITTLGLTAGVKP